jgi:hypothetical protein
MYFGLIVHMIFGFFMFTNKTLFTSHEQYSILDDTKEAIDSLLIDQLGENSYSSSSRLSQPHAVLYLVGSLLLIFLVVFDHFTGLI